MTVHSSTSDEAAYIWLCEALLIQLNIKWQVRIELQLYFFTSTNFSKAHGGNSIPPICIGFNLIFLLGEISPTV